jgi:hypothetical protein
MLTYVCRICAWGLTLLLGMTLYQTSKKSIANMRKLHQIPCSRCQYFTNSCYIKCTVNPHMASTELAISCRDFVAYHATIS